MRKCKNPAPTSLPYTKLGTLSARLRERIKGQPDALERLAGAALRRELSTIPLRGCRDCFFFAGPTGVGKTETAESFAQLLFGANRHVIFDCSEFKTLERVMALLGDADTNRGGFGQAFARVPAGVWVFDEIEKSHPEFVHLFLQMLDAGRLTLANGQGLNLQDLYIFATSNLGSAEILGREHLPFASLERHVIHCIQKRLGPELLARFGQPYVFRPLSRDVQREIAAQHLESLIRWQASQGRDIRYDDSIVTFILHRGFSPRLGARPLLDFLREQVGNAIAEQLMAGRSASGRLVITNNRLQLVS